MPTDNAITNTNNANANACTNNANANADNANNANNAKWVYNTHCNFIRDN